MSDAAPSEPTLPSLEEILAEVHRRGIVDPALTEIKRFAGSTQSVVAALSRPDNTGNPELVLKINRPRTLAVESAFLSAYAGTPLLPALVHADPDHRYMIYRYLPGAPASRRREAVDKAALLATLARNLLSRYQSAPADMPLGYLEWPGEGNKTWQEFLLDRVRDRREVLRPHISDEDAELVEHLASQPHRRHEGQPLYLIHGDCGEHNFLVQDGRLSAVIDPTPIVGEPIYDLAYAFVSWPVALSIETLMPAVETLRAPETHSTWQPPTGRHLVEEIVIALYCRIATCLYHHPYDLPAYLAAWPYWKTALAEHP